ncbi:MAG: helix-turn-helix domain-containing protein [Candidatus Thorarchaeota archaeon]
MSVRISEAVMKAFRELGLTEYEVQAYVTLVDGGEMSASEVSSVSRVPFSRIYDVLGRLEERGFIQINRGRPTRYIPKAPSEVMKLISLEWETRLRSYTRAIVDELQPRFERDIQATTRDVWLLHGRSAILAKAFEMLDDARVSVMLSIPSLDTGSLASSDMSDIVNRVLNLRTPSVRILTSAVTEDLPSVLPPGFEVRLRSRVFGTGLVVDRQHTLIMLSGDRDDSFLGIYASAPIFAEMSSRYFDSLWSESTQA